MTIVPALIGQTVLYTLTETDTKTIKGHRLKTHTYSGIHIHYGTEPAAGDVLPMVITKVLDRDGRREAIVNGRVLLDGNDVFWVRVVGRSGELDTCEPGRWTHRDTPEWRPS